MRIRLSKSACSQLLFAVFVLLGACNPSNEPTERAEPLRMWSIDFGTGADAQNQVTGPTRTFAPTSTVYASIETHGVGHGTIMVEWAAGSTVISTEKQEIAPKKPGEHFIFHFAPPDGWPKGMNHVRFSLDDGEKHVADFTVE